MAVSVAAVTKGLAKDEWLQLRKQGIGGSDASAVAGVSRYKSPITVFMEKTGQYEPDEPGEPAYWGNQLEDLVAREFSTRTGLRVQRSHKMYQHPKYPFMLGNVDRFIIDKERGRGVLECKTASAYKAEEWKDGRVPDEYAIQLQHYMAVLNVDYGYFAVLIGGNRFEYQFVKRNPSIIESLIELERRFWNEHVRTGVAPPVDGSQASVDWLDERYPTSRPSELELTSQQNELVKELQIATKDAKVAEERVNFLKNQLKSTLQDNEIGLFNGEPVITWKSAERNQLDTKRLKQEQYEIYQKYTITTSSRRILVK